MNRPIQLIYYDDVYDDMDGNGWNIIEPGGAIALRYPTMRECVEYCIDNNERYVILSPDVTNREAITLLRDIERV